MFLALLHLIRQSLWYMPSIVSGNWTSIFLPVAIFLLREAVRVKREGWSTVKWKGVGVDSAYMIGAYVAMFAWAIIHTVYGDHEYLVGANRSLQGIVQQASEINGKIVQIVSGRQGRNRLIIVSVEVSNPIGPPTTLSDWGLQVFSESGFVMTESLGEPGVEMPIPIAGTANKITWPKDRYCPAALEKSLGTGDARTCWFWGTLPGKPFPPRTVPDVIVSFVNVHTGKTVHLDSRTEKDKFKGKPFFPN